MPGTSHRTRIVIAALAALVVALAVAVPLLLTGRGGRQADPPPSAATPQPPPAQGLHLAMNGNFGPADDYLPGRLGFTLADVASPSRLARLPAGVQALVWVGRCDGVTPSFTEAVRPYLGSSRVFGYYLLDEPDPTGRWRPLCPPANLAAESDYIHQHSAGQKTFIVMMNLGPATGPGYLDNGAGYTPSNTHLDLVGLDPYPCRSELSGCAYAEIGRYVGAAEAIGWNAASVVPIYQAFGGGSWRDGAGQHWVLPTAEQETAILAAWRRLIPHPVFDGVYSWGRQRNDTALADAPAALQNVFAAHNRTAAAGSR